MNRKLINVFFVATLLVGGASVFSSCKDTDQDMFTELKADNGTLKTDLSALQQRVSTLEQKVSTLEGYNIAGIKSDVDKLKSDLAQLQSSIADQKSPNGISVDLLNSFVKKIEAVESRANSTVSSILIQATNNPVIGTFALPWNVRSNMLLTYYGAMDASFPNLGSADNIGDILPSNALEAIGLEDQIEVAGEVSAIDVRDGLTENYLGTVYATINPSNVTFENNPNLKVTLVNSQDENYGEIALTGWAPSDEVLEFGVSRAADNGFYEASAIAGNLDEIKIDVSGLGTAFKEVLKNRDKASLKNLAQVVVSKLDENSFPALGLKAEYTWNTPTFGMELVDNTWTVKDYTDGALQSASTYSQYAIAASAMEPLSFAFLQGVGLDKLPTLPDVDLTDFDLADYINIKIESPYFEDIEVSVNLSDVDLTITVPEIVVKDEHGTVVGTCNLDPISVSNIDEIEDALNEALSNAMANVTNAQEAITDMVNKINAQIKDAYTTVNDKVHAVGEKLKTWLDRAQALIDKVNDLLADPNHYLQVCMLYHNGDGIHRMSTSSAAPSYFPGADPGAYLTLIPTTYTAEIVAPSYMKYVAVTKAWKGSEVKSAAELQEINEEMGILPGSESIVEFPVEAGWSYQIAYQALDYHGVTSTRVFYVEIGNE